MRIVYGVHGYGRGHATRTLAVLPELARKHQLLVLAGGDAYPTFWPDFPLVRIPTLGFAYQQHGNRPRQRSNWQTFRLNFPGVLDLYWRGPTFDMVRQVVQEFAPDVVISDAEPWTHQVAASLKIPRISFDHIGILAHCHAPIHPKDKFEAWVDATCYRLLMGKPDRILISSFYDALPKRPGVRVIGTLPRQSVRNITPTFGDQVVVYFNRGHDQLHPHFLNPLERLGVPVHIYGTPKRGRYGALTFLPPSNLPFLEDLASCRAVISTAGNQLVGEALYFGKPLLVMPERCVEQRMNARAVEKMGIGQQIPARRFTEPTLRAFLARVDEYRSRMVGQFRDGLPEALLVLDQFLKELAPDAYASKKAAPDAQSAPPQMRPT